MPERTAHSIDPLTGRMLSRRDIGRLMSSGVAAMVLPGRATGATLQPGRRQAATVPGTPVAFRLSSNENNYGLAPAAIAALKLKHVIGDACRYGGESTAALTAALARAHGVPAEHIMLAAGSGEILRAVTLAFSGPGKALVTASPTFESPGRTAQAAKADVRAIAVAADGTLDLKAMAAASSGVGLAFVCNPNNPTGGINPESAVAAFIKEFRAASPDGYVLVDEAYCDYVIDASYASAIPITMTDPRVLVSRTFSKIHGMAGIRVGYVVGHPDALAAIRAKTSSGTLSSVSAAAALASFEDQEHLIRQRALNREARAYTRKAFESAGCKVLPSEGNFVMVDVKREAAVYQQMCRDVGVAIARPFPPLTTYARITIGTMDEMRKAMNLIIPLLSAPARTLAPGSSAARGAEPLEHDDYGC
jgi:histidinol-phosphate aminotransferase